MSVSVRQLGVISYRSCLALQKELVQLYKARNTSKVCVCSVIVCIGTQIMSLLFLLLARLENY